MRKGSWLNRPVIIKQAVETNKYDVMVARAKALPDAINAVAAYNGGKSDYYYEVQRLTRATTKY